ncbi:MAG: sugar ABC transporter ATP-binding protein [Candidatus Hydrogenedens sp.]|nr:sugar ABC transporter ATP-binding protein [Candidatus Hydrogenedens sp.]
MEGVSKRFPGTLAVDNVDFSVFPGEIHALMGENGAGKSTLMKILTGAFDDYTGEIRIGGRAARLHSPAAAMAQGVGMVHQELSLARPLSIAENLFAGRLPANRFGFVDRRALLRGARQCLELVGLGVDPLRAVGDLSPHEAQLVEIARVLGGHPCILILDEPTSSLSREEVLRLFNILRDLRNGGLAIVYISHHLPEVFEIADRVTVMRDGRRIATDDIHSVTPQSLVRMMVGRSMGEFYRPREAAPGPPLLRVDRLTRLGFFHDVSLTARAGEILGVAGLAGAGRTELARSLCGLDPVDFGAVYVDGAPLAPGDYPRAVKQGVVYLSEDRKGDGLFLRLSVGLNLAAGRRDRAAGAPLVQRWLAELDIAAASPDSDTGTLSGGNQQKVLLGRCLEAGPRVLLLDEPTRGVDVGAKRKIHDAVLSLAERGAAVLLVSSDLPELAGLSDRVVVLRNGRLIGELQKAELSEESLLLAANGHLGACHAEA